MVESFRKLGISEDILKVIHEMNFSEPSEVQAKAIPLALAGKDVIAASATGSGKTLAFGTGIIQNLERGKGIQALILTPTRELAEQITKALENFSKYKPIKIVSIYGGVSINPQMFALRDAEVVVATPGRVLDHLQRGSINLENLKVLVLDEADRMLDMGFIDDVDKIIHECPAKGRQTLLFSATISPDIVKLSGRYMKDPVEVNAESYVDPSKLVQVYYDVEDNQKFSVLVHLLEHEKAGLVMVFCNTRKNVDFIVNNLVENGIEASALHGGFSQERRNKTMGQFHAKNVHVLVCTDVAARGLDIKGVSHVYNYDCPKDSKEYIHRVGRTARAGKEGIAINLIASRDYENFNRVLQNRELKITKEQTPHVQRVAIRWVPMPTRKFGRDSRSHYGENKYNDRGRNDYSPRKESRHDATHGRSARPRHSGGGFRR